MFRLKRARFFDESMSRITYLSILLSLLIHFFLLFLPSFVTKKADYRTIELIILDYNSRDFSTRKTNKSYTTSNTTEKNIMQSIPFQEKKEPDAASANEIPKETKVEFTDSSFSAPYVFAKEESKKIEEEAKKPVEEAKSDSFDAPQFIHKEIPQYPFLARKLKKEGRVLLRLTIDENGKVLNIEVLEDTGYGFAQAAIEAVKKSIFRPATRNGVPVQSKALLPVVFKLKKE